MAVFFCMGFHKMKPDKNILVYLQNNGDWMGSEFSSSILSCNADVNQMESLINHAVNFVFRSYRNYPIRWKDLMNNKLLSEESAEGEMIGDEIRERCFLIDDVHFRGGYIGGGKSGNKIVQTPELFENHLPVFTSKKQNIVMGVCTFEDGFHSCDVEVRKGKIEDVRKYQNIINQMMLNNEKDKWKRSRSRKKALIIEKLTQINKRVGL
jgi:hypothetical protein